MGRWAATTGGGWLPQHLHTVNYTWSSPDHWAYLSPCRFFPHDYISLDISVKISLYCVSRKRSWLIWLSLHSVQMSDCHAHTYTGTLSPLPCPYLYLSPFLCCYLSSSGCASLIGLLTNEPLWFDYRDQIISLILYSNIPGIPPPPPTTNEEKWCKNRRNTLVS